MIKILIGTFIALLLSSLTYAGNGINDFAYGAISAGLGGADIAINSGAFALNINPAALAYTDKTKTEFNVQPFYYFNSHDDQYGPREDLDPQASAVFGVAHAHPLKDSGFTLGLGLFAQGGVGFTYKDINTAFGNEDTVSSSFGSFKLQSALAWESLDGRLRLGGAFGFLYSEAAQELFPDTSVDDGNGNVFYGIKVDGVSGESFSSRIGFQYDIDPVLTVGASYATDSEIKLEDGYAVLDQSASGFGKVRYNNASIKGLNIASDFGVGLAYRGFDKWTVSADYKIVMWSKAMKSSVLNLSEPVSPAATDSELSYKSVLDWRDQKVIAIGAQYRINDFSNLYLGYNYGRNPLPESRTDPLLAVTAEEHFTIGYSNKITQDIEVVGTYIYQPPVKVVYTNESLPYGENAENRWEVMVAQLMLVYRW